MSTSTKVAISALLLAFSATATLAQSHIGDGRSVTAHQAKAYNAVPQQLRHPGVCERSAVGAVLI
jgi:hypothetical protein